MVNKWHSEPDSHLCKGFAEANSLSTEEGSVAHWVSWFAIGIKGPLVIFRVGIEACWLVHIGLDPLLGIVMDFIDQNREH